MNILQVHLELADVPPIGVISFEGDEVEFKISVENSENPIGFMGKRLHYVLHNEQAYSEMKLDRSEIVQTYRYENLNNGVQKINKNQIKSYSSDQIYSQDEIHSLDELECYDKIVLVRNNFVQGNNDVDILSLANLDLANRASNPFRVLSQVYLDS